MARECDVVAAHAALAPQHLLIAARRALFGLAAELAGLGSPSSAVLDNPVTRFRLGRVLAGDPPPHLAGLGAVGRMGVRAVAANGRVVRLAAGRGARAALAGALDAVTRQLPGAAEPSLLLAEHGEPFDRAAQRLAAGLAFAGRVDPALTDDLLAHVELVAVVRDGERLGSASAREYPGLLVVPEPSCALEMAEALVHEGAHQKLFDLAVTHDVLGAAAYHAPAHRPTWSAAEWPLEQVLAGWHAYTCLGRFAARLGRDVELHAGSLLPVARDRSAELLELLLASGPRLGPDGHRLITAVTGRVPAKPPTSAAGGSAASAGDRLRYRRVIGSARTVAGRPGGPPEIFWIHDGGVASR